MHGICAFKAEKGACALSSRHRTRTRTRTQGDVKPQRAQSALLKARRRLTGAETCGQKGWSFSVTSWFATAFVMVVVSTAARLTGVWRFE